jgi:hypothetical protein
VGARMVRRGRRLALIRRFFSVVTSEFIRKK